MKKALVLFAALLIVGSPIFAGVVKKSKSEVTFKGFGTYSLQQDEKITSDRKSVDSVTDFKGKGLLGSTAGKMFLRSGQTGEIIDLPAMTIYTLDHKKKEYTAAPIKKPGEELGQRKEEAAQEKPEKEQAREGDIKIIRSEFKVDETGETKDINQFSSRKYVVSWITEWENVRTGAKGTEKLLSDVWTTPVSDATQTAEKEEMAFYQEYMKTLGIQMSARDRDILGLQWLSVLQGLGKGGQAPKQDESKFVSEMKKIKGYPVLIDGKYFSEKQGGPEESAEQEESKGVGGLLGGFAKKALKKKPKPEEAQEPSFAYHSEVLGISVADLGASDFQVPANYKKK